MAAAGDADADVHQIRVAQCAEATVHLARRALRPGARGFVVGPDARMPLGKIQHDAERIPYGPLAVEQHRHQPAGRKFPKRVVIVRLQERIDPVFERNAQRPHQQPGPERPARVIPVRGDQRIGHRVTPDNAPSSGP
jgi:hypothetical protein